MLEYTSERRCFLMAKKGQKFNNYIFNTKELVLKEYKENRNIKLLSKKYNIPEGTIKTWTYKINHVDKFINQGQKRGRKKEENLTIEDYKEQLEILKKYQAFLKAQREKK